MVELRRSTKDKAKNQLHISPMCLTREGSQITSSKDLVGILWTKQGILTIWEYGNRKRKLRII